MTEFDIAEDGDYEIWIKATGPNGNSDSFFFVFDDGEKMTIDRITSYNVCYTKLLRLCNHNLAGTGVKDNLARMRAANITTDHLNPQLRQ